MFEPLAKALSQAGDPVFVGVLWRSLAWSALAFVGLHVLALSIVHHLSIPSHWGLVADIAGTILVSILTFWLFLPVAAGIATLYIERISRAVEQRFYPYLPPPRGEWATVQAWDGIVIGLKVLGLNLLALILALILPVIGWVLGWAIAAYAIGRGLFVAVAMRRMTRDMAESVYAANRGAVMAQGAVLALAAYIPLLNLLIPVFGVAAMVHVLDRGLAASRDT
jgi:uncharacterized protein involved in cysteine biosynthesis